jgi:membrane protein implicated in regulation of membrane protease activity
MAVLENFWGLSLNQTILLIAAILFVIDFFINSDVPTHISYILLCFLVALNVHAHILVKALCGLLAWFLLVFFHYWVWKEFLQKFTDNFVAPDKIKSGPESLIGVRGEVKIIEEIRMVLVKGDLWPIAEPEKFADGDLVVIIGNIGSELFLKKL